MSSGAAAATGALAPPAARPAVSPWLIALTVTIATFMEVLDTSIANVALPHIAGNLGASLDDANWVLTGYLVANAMIIPLSSWLSTALGRKRYYIGCVALFTITSALCGLATSLPMLIVWRIVQGIAGGGLQPVSQAILLDTFPPARRTAGMAVYGVAALTAPVLGPTLGGWITDNYSWRWIFYINIPAGLLSLLYYDLAGDRAVDHSDEAIAGGGGDSRWGVRQPAGKRLPRLSLANQAATALPPNTPETIKE